MMLERNKSLRRHHFVATAVVAFLPFVNALSMGLVFDDIPLIEDPSPLQDLSNLPDYFTAQVSEGTSFSGKTPYYRPLFSLSMALDYALWRDSPAGYHLTNVLLHVGVSLLVLLLGILILPSSTAALWAALLFAVHPAHSDSVAYIAARNDVLCTLFMLAAFILHVRWRDSGRMSLLLLGSGAYLLSLLSKEMSLTFPLLVILYESLVRKSRFWAAVRSSLPYVLVVGVVLMVRTLVLDLGAWSGPPIEVRMLTGLVILAKYLGALLVPSNPKVLYDVPLRFDCDSVVLASVGLISLAAAAVLWVFRRSREGSFPLLWTAVALAPVSGFLVWLQPAPMADRYLYLPSVGLALVFGLTIAWGIERVQTKKGRWSMSLVPGLIVALLAVITFRNNEGWRNSVIHSKRMIADAPDHPLGYYNLGNYYGRMGQNLEMARAYEQTTEVAFERHLKQGRQYLAHGHLAHARKDLEYVVALSLKDPRRRAEASFELGKLYLAMDSPTLALGQFRRAATLAPENAEYLGELAGLNDGLASPEPPERGAGSPAGQVLRGVVRETIAAGQYTYLLLEVEDRQVWTAIPQESIEIGTLIVIGGILPMEDFHSKTLGRTFEVVYFGNRFE